MMRGKDMDGENIYLDSAAAMPVRRELLESFNKYILDYSANPESAHSAGREAASLIRDAGERVSLALTGGDYKVGWSSSATEAINIVFGFADFSGKVILTSDSEHPAMLHAIERAGFCEIRKVPVKRDGLLDFDIFEKMINDDVAVVSVHHVQNETGAVQDLCEVRRLIDRKAPDALFVSDTVQSVAKIAIPWAEAGIDIAFIGGHKVGAVSGGALLYNLHREPDIAKSFSRHLHDLRSASHLIGRPDPAVCMGLADAVIYAESGNALCKASYLSKKLRTELMEMSDASSDLNILLPVPEASSSPYIVTFLMPPYQAEVIVRMLSDKGVMVSAGSACEASKLKPSSALTAVAGSEKNARTTIRVSFSYQSTISDLDIFMQLLSEVVQEY
jgi:cysteine desulfurase